MNLESMKKNRLLTINPNYRPQQSKFIKLEGNFFLMLKFSWILTSVAYKKLLIIKTACISVMIVMSPVLRIC